MPTDASRRSSPQEPPATAGRLRALPSRGEDRATIAVYRDGPLIVRGEVTITDPDGNPIDAGRDTVALCRCGRSTRKPFCDGSHSAAGWRAPAGDGR